MAVAWIGNREVTVEQAAQRAAELLAGSRCPVFSLDGDVHAWRAAIRLAERVGASYDQLDGAALGRELALFTDKGGMTVAPGEVLRRADCVVIVGEVPAAHRDWIKGLANSAPDLSGGGRRSLFRIGERFPKAAQLGEGGAAQTLAALRGLLAERAVNAPVKNADTFRKALMDAAYTVFLYSGAALDELAIEMLHGLVSDINRTRRASTLLLPASDDAWGGALTSTWMTGFAPRTGFGRGMPEYDPWRFDVQRMIGDGEADLHLVVSAGCQDIRKARRTLPTVAIARSDSPVPGAAVTIAIGEAGRDHDAVGYSSRVGTIVSVAAAKPSELLSAAAAIRLIAGRLPC